MALFIVLLGILSAVVAFFAVAAESACPGTGPDYNRIWIRMNKCVIEGMEEMC